jgi:hypothetical protein
MIEAKLTSSQQLNHLAGIQIRRNILQGGNYAVIRETRTLSPNYHNRGGSFGVIFL